VDEGEERGKKGGEDIRFFPRQKKKGPTTKGQVRRRKGGKGETFSTNCFGCRRKGKRGGVQVWSVKGGSHDPGYRGGGTGKLTCAVSFPSNNKEKGTKKKKKRKEGGGTISPRLKTRRTPGVHMGEKKKKEIKFPSFSGYKEGEGKKKKNEGCVDLVKQSVGAWSSEKRGGSAKKGWKRFSPRFLIPREKKKKR